MIVVGLAVVLLRLIGGCHIGGELPQGNRTKRNVSMSPAAMHPGANEMLHGGQWRARMEGLLGLN